MGLSMILQMTICSPCGTWISAINSNTADENTIPFETTNQPLGCPAGLYYCGTILTSSIVFIESYPRIC
jgi:hypothetical protein